MSEINYADAMVIMVNGGEVEYSPYGGSFTGSKLRIIPERTCATEPWKRWQVQEALGCAPTQWYLFRKSANTLINSRFRQIGVVQPPEPENLLDERLRLLQAEIDDIRIQLPENY